MTALASKPTFLRFPATGSDRWQKLARIAALLVLWIAAGTGVAPTVDRLGLSTVGQLVVPGTVDQLRQAAAATAATRLKPIDPTDAVALNASIPISDVPNPAARPFSFTFATEADRLRSIDCLAAAVYYEAASEPLEGQRAVAQVVLNRARHPAYPSTICGVVFQGAERHSGCQFTFTCDGSLRRAPVAAYWERARQVAEAAISGYVYAPVGWATHYHTNWVVPYWASSLTKLANVGTHIFYRWAGGWGRPPAFTRRHPGSEPVIAWLGALNQPAGRLPVGETGTSEAICTLLAPGIDPFESLQGSGAARQAAQSRLAGAGASAVASRRQADRDTITMAEVERLLALSTSSPSEIEIVSMEWANRPGLASLTVNGGLVRSPRREPSEPIRTEDGISAVVAAKRASPVAASAPEVAEAAVSALQSRSQICLFVAGSGSGPHDPSRTMLALRQQQTNGGYSDWRIRRIADATE